MSSPAGNSDYSVDKPKRKSARGRQLKRWDAGEDQLLLLYVDHVCVTNGIAIPWDDVAIAMEPRNSASGGIPMTGEAIKQHLAKVRAARESADMTVPPKLDRAARRRAANCMKNGVPMTPATLKGKGTGVDCTVYETPKAAQRSSLLPPPNKKEEAKQKRAAQKEAAKVKALATSKTPAKHARGRPAKKKAEDEDDDEDFDTPAAVSGTKKLRALEIKNYTLPDAEEDEDDEEDKSLLASGDGIYDAPGESDYDEPANKKAKTEKKAVRSKGFPKFQAPIAPMTAPASPAEASSKDESYGTKRGDHNLPHGALGYDGQYARAARQDSAYPGYGTGGMLSELGTFVNNNGFSSKSTLNDIFGGNHDAAPNLPTTGGFLWPQDTSPINGTESFYSTGSMGGGHFDGLPGGISIGSFNGPDMAATLSQEMPVYGSTPTLTSTGSFDSFHGLPDDSAPRFHNSQGFERGFDDDAGFSGPGFDELGLGALTTLGDEADAGLDSVVGSKENLY